MRRSPGNLALTDNIALKFIYSRWRLLNTKFWDTPGIYSAAFTSDPPLFQLQYFSFSNCTVFNVTQRNLSIYSEKNILWFRFHCSSYGKYTQTRHLANSPLLRTCPSLLYVSLKRKPHDRITWPRMSSHFPHSLFNDNIEITVWLVIGI